MNIFGFIFSFLAFIYLLIYNYWIWNISNKYKSNLDNKIFISLYSSLIVKLNITKSKQDMFTLYYNNFVLLKKTFLISFLVILYNKPIGIIIMMIIIMILFTFSIFKF